MKLLVALSRFPWPLEKGDKLRAWYQIKDLAQRHEVHLVCLSEDHVSQNDLQQVAFCKSVQVIALPKWKVAFNLLGALFNNVPFQVNYFKSGKMKAVLAETIQREKIEACLVQLIRLGQNIPTSEHVRWVLDYQDAFSIGMRSRSQTSNFPKSILIRSEAKRLESYELQIAHSFDELVIISERDAEALRGKVSKPLHVIPNGTSESFFEDLPEPEKKEFDLVFFGNMGYHPNVQAAKWLVEEVLPILQQRGLNPKLCIAGARPAASIKAYESQGITVTGFVDDIRSFVLSSKVSVVPLLGGQGLQNKLLESMALGVPVVATPVANVALGATNGEHLLVAEGAEAFADEIQRLLGDAELQTRLKVNARRFVEENFRWKAMNARLEAVLRG